MSDIDLTPSGPHPDGRIAWLRWALLCDGLRLENTGKKLLIGCYDQAILFGTKPALFAGRLVGAFEFVVPGSHKLQFRVRAPGIVGMGEMVSEDGEPGTYGEFDVPVNAFVEAPSVIALDWCVDGDRWGPPMIWHLDFADNALTVDSATAEAIKAQWVALSDRNSRLASIEAEGCLQAEGLNSPVTE